MKKIFAVILAMLALLPAGVTAAEDDIAVFYNGAQITFSEKNIVMNQRTLVQLRPIAEALDLGIEFAMESGSVILSNADAVVTFKLNSNIVDVNGTEITMDVPLIAHNNYTFVPIRSLVEPFGNDIVYDSVTRTITITTKDTYIEEINSEEVQEVYKPPIEFAREFKKVFFYQSQPDFAFENNGRGYCWTCSYAMLFSSLTENSITPMDVANYNIANGFVGNYMAPHESIARYFGFELVPALSEDSQYYGGFNLKGRGETSLVIASDEDAKNAICEALNNFPNGVIVRYEGYPHSMVAVDYDEKGIYFNDPAKAKGEHIPFEQTCLANYALSDISFMQAVKPYNEGV
ncbi:MAG: copper amine oxidase N-terminal domain-containing protein [Clostridia bacterium]|nr:copper amine oxidase N-terminal domain-containing protein [Clostridia bacterium]